MNKKSVTFFCIAIIAFFYFGNQFLKEKNDIIDHKKITIFVLDPLLGIHTKMITGERGIVTIVGGTKGLTHEIINQLKTDAIILGLDTLSKEDFFQKFSHFQGHYVTFTPYDTHVVLLDSKTLQNQIETLRDTFSDIFPEYRSYFYDRAGNYLYLLKESKKHLLARLQKYPFFPFVTVGSSFENFLLDFGLKKFHVGHFDTIQSYQDIYLDKKNTPPTTVQYLFYHGNEQNIPDIQGEIFHIPTLTDDTSSYGYIRFMEKTVNEFIAAFDTYD